jgi:predicted transcriptional regulator
MGMVDLDTGEVFEEGVNVLVGKRSKTPYAPGKWFMANQEGWHTLAKDTELTLRSRRVLDFLFGRLDFENWILVSQAEIAEELELDKANVCRAIKQLVDKGILFRGPKTGRSVTFRLNPRYGYKGDRKSLQNSNLLRLPLPGVELQGESNSEV